MKKKRYVSSIMEILRCTPQLNLLLKLSAEADVANFELDNDYHGWGE